ncbi:alcohol dehydrogenase [Sulfodiicoccus acidiphilus]|uniref:Alcohol dehydrogenase n=1 Tax=Sulfodiicoccus acidiphilus TaxID=1670455 RepID=A0A348B261_9CREN|nr:glucose 1-dehydrogenase [Sulfodiicoccus acidiphilus]BBD72263.1 alcohol dehydrogenase [Sulfodiicoccus acidiphilus]
MKKDRLVLGHEAIGVVEAVGSGVELRKGDLVVPIVRRGCGVCLNCKVGRQDFCETGNFVEAGIRGQDGFMRDYFVDQEVYMVRVPPQLREVGVLSEPLSNVVKGVEELFTLQRRTLWTCEDSTFQCRTAFVIGSGPIGLLFAMTLVTEGFNVAVLNRRDPNEVESKVTEAIGVKFEKLGDGLPSPDLIVDTAGSPVTLLKLLSKIKNNGAVVLFGTTSGEREEISADLITELVERNILVVGSVNASKEHFAKAVTYLSLWHDRFPEALRTMITSEVKPEEAGEALRSKTKGEVKTVLRWSQ